jgi:predicted ATPase
MTEQEQQQLHYKIGKRWLSSFHDEGSQTNEIRNDDRYLFDVVDHLNKGFSQIDENDIENFKELANLNLDVGIRAHKAVAYTSAINYLQSALLCFKKLNPSEEQSWKNYHDLGFKIYLQLATTNANIGDYTLSSKYVDVLLIRAQNTVELGRAYELRIMHENILSRFSEAMEVGFVATRNFGIILTTDANDLSKQMVEIEEKLSKIRTPEGHDLSSLLIPLNDYQCSNEISTNGTTC